MLLFWSFLLKFCVQLFLFMTSWSYNGGIQHLPFDVVLIFNFFVFCIFPFDVVVFLILFIFIMNLIYAMITFLWFFYFYILFVKILLFLFYRCFQSLKWTCKQERCLVLLTWNFDIPSPFNLFLNVIFFASFVNSYTNNGW